MWNRFGLAIVVLAAVVAAFLAGAVAPAGWRDAFERAASSLHVPAAAAGRLAGTGPAAAPGAIGGAVGASQAASDGGQGGPGEGDAGGGTTSASAAPAPAASSADLPLATLLRTADGDAAGAYALLVGQFGEQDVAERWSSGIGAQGVPSRVILVVDDAHTHWAMVSAGRFASAAEAESQRPALANRLRLPAYMPAIRLPPEKK